MDYRPDASPLPHDPRVHDFVPWASVLWLVFWLVVALVVLQPMMRAEERSFALAADKLVLAPSAVVGTVDPQIDDLPASAVLAVLERKEANEIDDETFMLADVARKAPDQIRAVLTELVLPHRRPLHPRLSHHPWRGHAPWAIRARAPRRREEPALALRAFRFDSIPR